MGETFTSVGVVSIGEMGLGIASLLIDHGYKVFTYAADRSENTQSRARKAGVELATSLENLVSSCSAILSIVPPRDAKITAQRIVSALSPAPDSRSSPLYYVDLNAVSPNSAVEINALLSVNPNIRHVDGGIIGGVPYPKERGADGKPNWHCPSLIVSGPDRIPDPTLAAALNAQHLDLPIGSATGLKMCFACTTKGFISLAIQSFATAQELGVMGELRAYLQKYNPSTLALAEKGLVTMPSKAYRWEHEMLEIAETMAENGGFEKNLFQGVAEVYRTVAEDSELGKEQPDARVRGKTVEDVIQLLSEGMKAKKLKSE
ncbi:6-phosphogluconate dehydrogenase [Leptodontidium sp. 2 PMI_412]|nr:6-phosphogluconate dehydrogenase [Leptodontidium sp. 2 PMI_412]